MVYEMKYYLICSRYVIKFIKYKVLSSIQVFFLYLTFMASEEVYKRGFMCILTEKLGFV